MKFYNALVFVAPLAALAAPAHAQDEQEGDWSVTVTPRYQHALFEPDPDSSSLEAIPTFGATVTVRDPSAKFGVTGTYLRGEGDGRYTFDNFADYDFDVKREELQFLLEFTPSQTGITFLAGYHRFDAEYEEALVGGNATDNDTTVSSQSVDAFELGLRIASRLGANSRHAVSMQFLGGIGDSRGQARNVFTSGGTDFIDEIDETGTGYTADFAIGYNYFISNRVTIGTRLRGYVFDAAGTDVAYAITPEANLSFRF